MSDYNWCHGSKCHEHKTQDRIRGVKGSKVLRTKKIAINKWNENNVWSHFCSQGCSNNWLADNMCAIEMGIPVHFIRERRFTQWYKKTTTTHEGYNGGTFKTNSIERIDNNPE